MAHTLIATRLLPLAITLYQSHCHGWRRLPHQLQRGTGHSRGIPTSRYGLTDVEALRVVASVGMVARLARTCASPGSAAGTGTCTCHVSSAFHVLCGALPAHTLEQPPGPGTHERAMDGE